MTIDIDIETERVRMRPEWDRMIDDWIGRCVRSHPAVSHVEVSLRHAEHDRRPDESVEIVATAGRRRLREARHGSVMELTLQDAFQAIDEDLVVDEAVRGAAPA